MKGARLKLVAVIIVILVGVSAYILYERRSSGGVKPTGKLTPAQSLKDIVLSVSSLKYTMRLDNSTYHDSYYVAYHYVGGSGSTGSIRVEVSKPPMNITIKINRDNGTVYSVTIDNGTGVTVYNGSRAPYIGFNVLKDALMPLVNPSMMSQIVDWSTMTSIDKNFQLRLLGSKEVVVSGRKYEAYMLQLTQPPGASNPIPGFVKMTYTVLDWKGMPVVYEMKVYRSDGVVTMHLDFFQPSK